MKSPMTKIASIALALTGMLLLPGAFASDHSNIEEGLPTQLEDAFPTAYRNREIQGVLRWDKQRNHDDRFYVEPRLEWGFARNWQAKFSVQGIAGEGDKKGNGNVSAEAFYNFNMETLAIPAFAASLKAELPTGEKAAGTDTTLKLIGTKTLGKTSQFHRVHVNLAWTHNAGREPDERSNRWKGILGYSTRLGPDTMLVADVVRQQGEMKGEMGTLYEIGLRRQITPLTLITLGVGAGHDDAVPKYRVTGGFQHSF